MYHNLNDELTESIVAKLEGNGEQDIQSIIQRINTEVYFINTLSQEYQKLFQRLSQYKANQS